MSEVAIAATRLGVVAAWTELDGALHVQPLEATGAPKGPSVQIAKRSRPSLGLFPLYDGSFLLAYGNCCAADLAGEYLLHIDATGAPLGGPAKLPRPDSAIVEVSSSGRFAAALLRRDEGRAQALLRIDTSSEPMRILQEDLPDTTPIAFQARPDGRVWLATKAPSSQLEVQLLGLFGEPQVPRIELPEGPLSLSGNGDLIVAPIPGPTPDADAWQLHAGAKTTTTIKIPRSEVLGSSTLAWSGDKSLGLVLTSPEPHLTLAQEAKRFPWHADSAWVGTSYLVIYVATGTLEHRDVVVQPVTCTKRIKH